MAPLAAKLFLHTSLASETGSIGNTDLITYVCLITDGIPYNINSKIHKTLTFT